MRAVSMTRNNKKMVNLFKYKKPNIVVIGGRDIHAQLNVLERDLHVKLIFTSEESLNEAVNGNTMAIIVNEVDIQKNKLTCVKSILEHFKMLPVFYLANEERRSTFYHDLYELGIESVINWPKDAIHLKELIIEILKPHPLAIGESRGDKKLSEVVKSHLLVMGGFKNVKVKVINGFVFLKGKLKNLYDKKKIYEKSSEILGVKQVISKNLKVENQKVISDSEIARRITLFANNYIPDNKSLVVKVKNRNVLLMGTLKSQEEVDAIERFAMKQAGVKSVINNIEINVGASLKTNKKAKLIERRIRYLFDGIKHISLKIYGDYVEAKGIVKTNTERALIEDYLFQVLPVKRVVNKIHTSSA